MARNRGCLGTLSAPLAAGPTQPRILHRARLHPQCASSDSVFHSNQLQPARGCPLMFAPQTWYAAQRNALVAVLHKLVALAEALPG